MLFRNIFFSALLVGVIAGGLSTAVQFFQVIPIIISAEAFEGEGETAPASTSEKTEHNHASHDHATEEEWGPEDGLERTAYTLLTNILTAIGFALLILAAIVASQKPDDDSKLKWHHGLLWGLSGYVIFFVAPALGLPPEIPGTNAAPLETRQIWWIFAVICTAGGIGGAVFVKQPWRWALLGLLVIPHLVGAPHIEEMFADKPPAVASELTVLTQEFIIATAITTATLWITLGITSVWTVRRFILPQ
ncbi:MAG: CbtA family protein [Pseudomonadota bacterium]|nr:CbtA family protein [Pseudomonadota bacterium]